LAPEDDRSPGFVKRFGVERLVEMSPPAVRVIPAPFTLPEEKIDFVVIFPSAVRVTAPPSPPPEKVLEELISLLLRYPHQQ
jgi:hypothetical protein